MINDSKITVTELGKGNKEKRKVSGTYPKWELMASHVCRRSFCTNLYGALPTPLIMSISAHSSEKMLLNYIGKDSLDFAQQIADFYTLQALREKKEPQLKVVKPEDKIEKRSSIKKGNTQTLNKTLVYLLIGTCLAIAGYYFLA